MKALILGSIKASASEGEFEEFKSACRDIGRELTANGHTVILGSDNTRTADRYVMEGIASVRGQHDVVVHCPDAQDEVRKGEENATPFIQDGAPIYPEVKIRRRNHSGSWAVAHVAAIRDSDVVILIGGGLRCDLVGHFACVLEKPVLAVKIFHGAAEKVWSQFQLQYENCGITEDEIAAIAISWTKKSSESAVVSSARKLYERSPFKRQSPMALFLVSSISLVSVVFWIAIFLGAKAGSFGFDLALFSLLGASVFMGTGLRVGLTVLRDSTYSLRMNRLYAELVSALVLSIGFMLLYFVGALVINGDIKKLNGLDDFSRISISLSLIGIATGLLLERAAKDFIDRLAAVCFKQAR